jgi:GNAT superfamily N-acetyltransferase
VIIRKAEINDLTDLERLAGVLGYPIADNTEFAKRFEKISAQPEHIILVAVEDGVVHGYIESAPYSTLIIQHVYIVLGLVVDTDFQDRGFGGQLIEALETEAKNCGADQIILNSGERRHLAHEFYEKHGYELDHLQKKFVKILSS